MFNTNEIQDFKTYQGVNMCSCTYDTDDPRSLSVWLDFNMRTTPTTTAPVFNENIYIKRLPSVCEEGQLLYVFSIWLQKWGKLN